MKLFNYDEKHERVNGELDLGELTPSESKLLDKIVAWMGDQGFTSRYQQLEIAERYEVDYDHDAGESFVSFLDNKKEV